jgi:maltokinase
VADVSPDLARWMAAQRWFAGKGRTPRLEMIGGFRLDTGPEVETTVHLVLDRNDEPKLYQVPVTERRTALTEVPGALISRTEGRWLYDGTHDPAFARAVLRLMLGEGAVDADDGTGRVTAFGHSDLKDELHFESSRVLDGEQSNTSIVITTTGADGASAMPVICKLFRTLHDGENPDVVLTAALGRSAPTVVPRSVGHLTGRWADLDAVDGMATGHLAFAQEFLPGVEDAWRVATAAAATGEDFRDRAQTLGGTTAVMHRALATAFPSPSTTPADIALVLGAMRTRFDQAVREVPGLETHRAHLEMLHSRARTSVWPALQRIHGDFHLGQVLSVPDHGWVVLDFEGEPLRLMRERSAPDSPLRDIAGMLRSFDYVAGSHALIHPGEDVSGWAGSARRAFLEGYTQGSGDDLLGHRELIDLFEIDKAIYEAIYEARNRPPWLPIPLAAIERLLS